MAARVRRQREALAAANAQLGKSNAQLATANGALNVANGALNGANAKLSDANRDLERKVADRTGQLEAANRRLSGEISEKEDFLRAVSHDLNAPLRNIAGMAAMLVTKHGDKLDADALHRLERIQKNVQVETDLIGELLELSRIKTRRGDAERVDTAALVADVAGVFEQDLQTKGIALVVDGPLPPLTAERARVRQVFQNLIDNAIKYMGERPGQPKEIHVGCAVGPDEVTFEVRDTGIGIDADDLDKVFHVFRRGRNAAASNVPGKGVGLASVKAIGRDVQRDHLGREHGRRRQHVPVHRQRGVRGPPGAGRSPGGVSRGRDARRSKPEIRINDPSSTPEMKTDDPCSERLNIGV